MEKSVVKRRHNQKQYVPSPVDTTRVRLGAGIRRLTELLARNAHEVWALQRMSEGWHFGPRRNDRRREHPCLVPYEQLPESEKQYDRNSAMETLKTMLALGYVIKKK